MGALGSFSRPSIRVMGPEALRGPEGKIEDVIEDMIKDTKI